MFPVAATRGWLETNGCSGSARRSSDPPRYLRNGASVLRVSCCLQVVLEAPDQPVVGSGLVAYPHDPAFVAVDPALSLLEEEVEAILEIHLIGTPEVGEKVEEFVYI